ncbi:uncharacterized protein [Ptychodera flava]|uniref:uncharacterized protein n=1 Tax=Ptychodera flava TaxID=63121 RepID=UPI00396AA477
MSQACAQTVNTPAGPVISECKFPIDANRFSIWTRFVRTTAWVLRFISLIKARRTGKSIDVQPYLEVCELQEADKQILKYIQMERFANTIRDLKVGRLTRTRPLKSLSPFLDSDGILRVGGRLQRSSLPYDAKHPLLVPCRNHIATLIVRHYHIKVGRHSKGVNAVLSETRQRYWIVHGREEVKRVQYDCRLCCRRRKKVAEQIMAPLPSHRITVPVRAFAKSGVDNAGPFYTKLTRRVIAKRYLCLFTCTTSRAVHLELAYSMDTDSFRNAISRMVARRGKPEEVISDNGTNFVGANRELGELICAMDQLKIVDSAANKGIIWKFNPPLGSHHGGLFEALIKSAKVALKAILGDARVTDEELHTAIVEVEGLMNSRPLTYCSNDPTDEPVLTPNHFLYGQAGGQLAPRVVDEVACSPKHRWRFIQDLVNQVWKRWNREYLSLLQNRGKWWTRHGNVKVNDIVTLVDPANPRGHWPLGRIEEVYPGRDGCVRTVKVLSQGRPLIRPITKVCPLEAKSISKQEVTKPVCYGGKDGAMKVKCRPTLADCRICDFNETFFAR